MGKIPLVVSLVLLSAELSATELNGFVVDDPLIPVNAIERGGPPRDGIPSIDRPRFVNPDGAGFLGPEDRVLGVVHNGFTRAYPLKILNRHEIVNDIFGDEAVIVTFCPLCGSGAAFSAEIGAGGVEFGVSGLLYNSDVLLYDRRTESLWSQIMMRAVSGPMKGRNLDQIPLRNTTWRDWQERHPDTKVLSTDTGFRFIDYDDDPYAEYKSSRRIWFPLTNSDRRLPEKEWVLGVLVAGKARAYPLSQLAGLQSPMQDLIGTTRVSIEFDIANGTAVALADEDTLLRTVQLYWFAWAAFHPDTDIFADDGS